MKLYLQGLIYSTKMCRTLLHSLCVVWRMKQWVISWTCPSAYDVCFLCSMRLQKIGVTDQCFANIATALSTRLNITNFLFFAFVYRFLWVRKNSIIHDDLFTSLGFVHQQALDYQNALALKHHPPTNIVSATYCWSPPPSYMVKVNLYVVSNVRSPRLGIGVILRDSSRSVLACLQKPMYYYVESFTAYVKG